MKGGGLAEFQEGQGAVLTASVSGRQTMNAAEVGTKIRGPWTPERCLDSNPSHFTGGETEAGRI